MEAILEGLIIKSKKNGTSKIKRNLEAHTKRLQKLKSAF